MSRHGSLKTPRSSDGFAGRLRQVLADFGSASALARAIGRSEGAVRKWVHGKSEPGVSDLRQLCEVTGTSVEWLVTGRGHRVAPVGAVREPDVPPAPRPVLDYQLLDAVMQGLDEELRAAGLEVPHLKRSSMIQMLYEMFRETRQVDRDAVARMVQLMR